MLVSRAGDTAERLLAVGSKGCFTFADGGFCSHREVPAGTVGQGKSTGFNPVPSGYLQAA